jgi:rfaE bifunctional protein nucleotidyltransferase chain/domain
MIKVTCNGCFDGLHAGHMFFLGYALAQGDSLVVAINSDDYIIRSKNRDPNFSQEERKRHLMDLGFIDKVVIFDEETPEEFLLREQPDIHVNGSEYGEDCVESVVLKKIGAKLSLVPRIGKWSTTNGDRI